MPDIMPENHLDKMAPLFENLKLYLDDVYPLKPKQIANYLDFGCGKFGGYSHFWKKYFSRTYVLDVFDYSKTVGGDVTFLHSEDCLTIPLPDRSIDFIAAHSVLEHVVNLQHTISESLSGIRSLK
jgi:SAM-dependent methyltransferase